MNNEYNFITLQDLEDVLDEASLLLLKEKNYETLPKLKQIEELCILFDNQYKIQNNSDQAIEKMYLFGTKIVFMTRQFLLQDELFFSVAATSEDGHQLFVKEFSQNDIFAYLKANLKNGQMELNSLLEQSIKKDGATNLSELWGLVYDAAKMDGNMWTRSEDYNQKYYITSKGQKRKVYQKNDIDINVWFRYYTRNKKKYITRYYNKGGTNLDLMQYNNGWLYEWFQEYIQEHSEQLRKAFYLGSKTPLKEMFNEAKRENIPGYKGGDYIDTFGRQVQAKMGNRRIITFASIRDVILGGGKISKNNSILSTVKLYDVALRDPEKAKQIKNNFMKLFTNNESQKINDMYEQRLDNLLKTLNINLT